MNGKKMVSCQIFYRFTYLLLRILFHSEKKKNTSPFYQSDILGLKNWVAFANKLSYNNLIIQPSRGGCVV